MVEEKERELTDDEMKYKSLTKSMECKQDLHDEIDDKFNMIAGMMDSIELEAEEYLGMLSLYVDSLNLLVRDHDSFVGDNLEVLSNSEHMQYDYISTKIKYYKDLLAESELEMNTLKGLSDDYERRMEKLFSEYHQLGYDMDEVMENLAAVDSDVSLPTSKIIPAETSIIKNIDWTKISMTVFMFAILMTIVVCGPMIISINTGDTYSDFLISQSWIILFCIAIWFIIREPPNKRKTRRHKFRR